MPCARASPQLERELAEQVAAANAIAAAAQERALLARPLAPRPQRPDGRPGAAQLRARSCGCCADPCGASGCSSAACSDEPDVVGRDPRQGRGALARGECSPRSRAQGSRRSEVLVIDSGSRDDSVAIAARRGRRGARDRAAPSSGTAARATSAPSARPGSSICFLTQDATPRARLARRLPRGVRRVADDVGAAYGPHLAAPGHVADDRARARPSSSPASRPTARPPSRAPGDPPFLSNVNAVLPACAAGSRSASTTCRTRRTRRSAARCSRPAGRRCSIPAPRCCTPTTTARSAFMRRYFDEYRGLRETIGHVERIGVRSTLRDRPRPGRRRPALDARAGRRRRATAARWTGRSAAHHGGPQGVRRARLARATGCPRRCSARSRSREAPLGVGGAGGPPPTVAMPPRSGPTVYRRRPRGSRAKGRLPLLRPGRRAWRSASSCTSPS